MIDWVGPIPSLFQTSLTMETLLIYTCWRGGRVLSGSSEFHKNPGRRLFKHAPINLSVIYSECSWSIILANNISFSSPPFIVSCSRLGLCVRWGQFAFRQDLFMQLGMCCPLCLRVEWRSSGHVGRSLSLPFCQRTNLQQPVCTPCAGF